MAQQTAVEWLAKELEGYGDPEFCDIAWKDLDSLVERAKQMEKEQMIEFAEFVASHPDKNRNYLGDMLHAKSKYDGAERTVDILEQYYNKKYHSNR